MTFLAFKVISLQFVILGSAWAQDPVAVAIERGQALALKKNRQEACTVLQRALESTPAPAKASRAKLLEALHGIAKVFFTDKGQRAFEAGRSLMYEAPDMALARFKEALDLESDNIQILDNMARVQLMKPDCPAALATLNRARQMNPWHAEAAVLELRALLCAQQMDILREKAKNLPALDRWEESFVQFILAQELLAQGQAKKAAEMLTKVTEEQPAFPEAYYHLGKALEELGRAADAVHEKYVSLCKAITSNERKKYSLEPRLCVNQKEVQDELAKKNSDL
ncbi:MAG: tetratricopeptide repeat protein [Calothrix sp. SM1_5_4]|nr:tetratricopeptide repeat protein [Calothrix sp. SM1_5_4]